VSHGFLMSDSENKTRLAALRWKRREDGQSIRVGGFMARRPAAVATSRKPDGSLSALALALGKDSRTVRRYCEKGFVPGATITAGGHWRVKTTRKTVLAARLATVKFSRHHKIAGNDKGKLKRSLSAAWGIGTETAVVGKELFAGLKREDADATERAAVSAAEKRLDHSALMAAALLAAKKKLYASTIAKVMGISRATLYRHFTKREIRSVIKAALNPAD